MQCRIDSNASHDLLAIPLDELQLTFRAGNMAEEKIKDILSALDEAGMDPLTYLDYLVIQNN